MRNKGPTICIVMEGGCVQSVVTNDGNALSDLQIMVVDYDTEGADQSGLIEVRQQDGGMADAAAYRIDWQPASIDLDNIADQIDARDAEAAKEAEQ